VGLEWPCCGLCVLLMRVCVCVCVCVGLAIGLCMLDSYLTGYRTCPEGGGRVAGERSDGGC